MNLRWHGSAGGNACRLDNLFDRGVKFQYPPTNPIQNDAIVQQLIEEGIITQKKFFAKLKQVQAQYEAKQ